MSFMEQGADAVLLGLEAFLASGQSDFDDQVRMLLEMGSVVLGMEAGMLSCVQAKRYGPMVVHVPPGQVQPPDDGWFLEDTLCYHLGALQEPVWVDSLENLHADVAFARHFSAQSYCAAPLVVDGSFFGTLAFFDRQTNPENIDHGAKSKAFLSSSSGLSWLRVFAALLGAELGRRTANRALRAATSTLKRLSRIDPVTQLLNRRGIDEKIARLAARHEKGGGESTAMRLSLGEFRAVNDQFGHAVGDVVLGEVAHTLATAMRPSDLLARVGGASFLAVLCDTDRSTAQEVAARLLKAVQEHRTVCRSGLVRLQVTGSVGTIDRQTTNLDALYQRLEPFDVGA